MADETPFNLSVQRADSGPRIVATRPDGEIAAEFALTRADARTFARELLAAAGDGTERTFVPEKARG
ncbi:MAG: hypothetical protein WAP03_21725 [Methylorubrum rhodinum]|uniref:hypothetical protein n=1 Tax=Methylorubrum rhodinum TaxID=29428 RepID=UPI003BAFB133